MFQTLAWHAANRAANNPKESESVKREAREFLKNCGEGRVSDTSKSNMFFQANQRCRAGTADPYNIDKINGGRSIELSNMSQRSREREYEKAHSCCVIL